MVIVRSHLSDIATTAASVADRGNGLAHERQPVPNGSSLFVSNTLD